MTNRSRDGVLHRDQLELLEIALTDVRGIVDSLQVRLVPLAHPRQLAGPLVFVMQFAQQRDQRLPIVLGRCRHAKIAERLQREAARSRASSRQRSAIAGPDARE